MFLLELCNSLTYDVIMRVCSFVLTCDVAFVGTVLCVFAQSCQEYSGSFCVFYIRCMHSQLQSQSEFQCASLVYYDALLNNNKLCSAAPSEKVNPLHSLSIQQQYTHRATIVIGDGIAKSQFLRILYSVKTNGRLYILAAILLTLMYQVDMIVPTNLL